MFKKINVVLSFSLAALLFFAVVLPEVAVASSEKDLDEVNFEMFNETSEEIDAAIDEYCEGNGLSSFDSEKMTEKELDEYFEQLLNTEEYLSFENEVSDMSQNQQGQVSARAVPILLAPIGIIALRILVTQGSKAAMAYLKKATKNLTKKYKITFPNTTKQLILVQDKKTKARIFSVDKHPVEFRHKTTGKGHPNSIKPWHFHGAPDMGQHLMLCSSVPKNYKIKKGKCYF